MPSARVLVVDDEPALADLYRAYLEDSYDVQVARSGEEAVDAIDEEIDVVLLDRTMPGRSGDEVLDEIRRKELNCRVAMVTAVDPDINVISMEFDEYLVKPVSKSELLTVVERLVSIASVDSAFQEYAALATKRAMLAEELSEAELNESAEFASLEARLTERTADVNALLDDFTGDDVEIVLHDGDWPDQDEEAALIDEWLEVEG